MERVSPLLRSLGCAALLLAFAACGAGLFTGVASSTRGSGSGEARAPELSLDPVLPLVPAPNTTRTVVVANAQIAASARLRVRIDAAGAGVDQVAPTVSGQGGSTLIAFTLATQAIVAAVGDPTAGDVNGVLTVFVDDRPIAQPAPVLLARQPRAELVLPASQPQRFLSPFGERVELRIVGLRSTAASELQLLVTTIDATRAPEAGQPPPTVTRLCTDLRVEPPRGDDVPIVSAVVPGNPVPVQARLFVRDAAAGQSTTIENAFYRPDIAVALPSQGPTTGGSLVTLIGTALVPLEPSRVGSVPGLAFDAVELSFTKGGRRSVLPPEDFRIAESGSDRLVFTMPPSPDGRPGQVDVNLRVQIGAVPVQITASQVFLFANPKPFFGPRGAVLERMPVAVVPISLDAAGDPAAEETAAPDFAVLTDQGGVGFLQLLLSQKNGMFQPFAAPRRIGDPEVANERGPRDICSGDFDGDQVPDLFLANEGTVAATHHVVIGRARPDTPLGAAFKIAGPSAARCRSARFDANALDDVLLMPSANAPSGVPVVLLATPGPLGPAFVELALPVRPLRHEAVEIADLDGDGHLDVALLRGTTLQLDVAWGDGNGGFTSGPGSQLDFTIPGYVPDPASPAVGLHACRNGQLQSLGFVLAGLSPTPPLTVSPTQPAIGILPQPTARGFVAPIDETTAFAPIDPFGQSLVADLDEVPPVELVVSVAGNPQFISLAVVRYDPAGWRALEGGVEIGAEGQQQVRALHFARAFAPTADVPEANAVFMVHESVTDGEVERRLSTRLVFSSGITLRVLPPDAGAIIPTDIGSIVGGNFHPVAVAGAGRVNDLALGQPGAVQLVQNDGYGGFPKPSNRLQWPGLLPGSVALLPSPTGAIDRVVFVDDTSRLGVWRHVPSGATIQAPDATSERLRDVANASLAALPAADTTRIRVGDVDGDQVDDLVVLLRFVGASGANGAAVALLRGKAQPGATEFPFHQPTALTPVHANASAIVLGDFAATTSGPPQLELAVAVPEGTTPGAIDGDHVRFFRYRAGASPADDVFEPSAIPGDAQVLLAGDGPTQLAAADLDRDGLVDLLVAGAGDGALRLFRNVSLPQPASAHVDIESFVESLSSPQPMAPGTPTALHLSDVNGDGNVDAVVTVEFVSSVTAQRSTSVAFHLSSGSGEFSLPQFVSPARVGDRDRRLASAIGDFNRDGIQDLLLAWPSLTSNDRNVRVLFGGTR